MTIGINCFLERAAPVIAGPQNAVVDFTNYHSPIRLILLKITRQPQALHLVCFGRTGCSLKQKGAIQVPGS